MNHSSRAINMAASPAMKGRSMLALSLFTGRDPLEGEGAGGTGQGA